MIDGVTNAGSMPVLERLMQFAGARHRVLAHNMANVSTPGFRPVDVSPADFQAQLRASVDARRERHGPRGGPLELESTEQVEARADGLALRPAPIGANILFHDGNDRDLERGMQSLVENFMAFRTAAELMRGRFELINAAIRERI